MLCFVVIKSKIKTLVSELRFCLDFSLPSNSSGQTGKFLIEKKEMKEINSERKK